MSMDAAETKGSDMGLIFERMDCLSDVIRRIEQHPSIDSVRIDRRNYPPCTYIVLYSSNSERGFGGCMLISADFNTLKDRFSNSLNFIEL